MDPTDVEECEFSGLPRYSCSHCKAGRPTPSPAVHSPTPPPTAGGGFRRASFGPSVPTVIAEYDGECSSCGGDVFEGDPITPHVETRLINGSPVQVRVGWKHLTCPH